MDKKAKKASVEQKLFLVQFMEDNMDFAYDRFECTEGSHKKYKIWQDLTAKLNSISGAVKDANQWRKFWTDQKLRVKEREALLKASFQRSCKSGFRNIKELSPYERRVLSLSAPVAINEDAEDNLENAEVLKEINTITQIAPSTSAGLSLPPLTPLVREKEIPSISAEVSNASPPLRKRRRPAGTTSHTSYLEEKILTIAEEKLRYIKKEYNLKKRKMEWQKEYQMKCLLLRERELNLRERELELKIQNNNV